MYVFHFHSLPPLGKHSYLRRLYASYMKIICLVHAGDLFITLYIIQIPAYVLDYIIVFDLSFLLNVFPIRVRASRTCTHVR